MNKEEKKDKIILWLMCVYFIEDVFNINDIYTYIAMISIIIMIYFNNRKIDCIRENKND